jgi:hypothetical protein
MGSGDSPVSYSEPISGLTPGTTYYYCAIAQSSGGMGFGAVISFTTTASVWKLSVRKIGNGEGTITSSPPGIDCGSVCDYLFTESTIVNLYAIPNSGSKFTGWSGDAACDDGLVPMATDVNCTAMFSSFPWPMFLPAVTGSGQH